MVEPGDRIEGPATSGPAGTLTSRLRGWRRRLSPRAERILGIVLSVLLLVFTLLWSRCGIRGCPDVDELRGYMPDEASVILDLEGEEVGKLFQVNRTIIPLDSLPEHVPQAFVVAEDRRFWDHGGVDWRRVPGALFANVQAGGIAQGFSTITMQLARNLFPDVLPAEQQTMWRKLGEMRVARDIEKEYSKEEILEMYVNQVYFGGGAWGIEAASQEYFGKSAVDLDVGEAALLAAILPAPSRLNPRNDEEAARDRQELVLHRMAEEGIISEEEAEAEIEEELDLARGSDRLDVLAPYFVEAVRQELEDVFGRELYTEGFRIYTTLDVDVQRAAEEELARQLRAVEGGAYGAFRHATYASAQNDTSGEAPAYLQGAVVVMDAREGGVLALVGGRDFTDSKYNRALQARRQPGSAFKPFVYATAIERGYPPTMILEDRPIRMTLSGGRVWSPGNYGDSYAGQLTMRDALVQSKNVATVMLAQQVGVGSVLRTAHSMGIESELPNVPAVVLGAGEVTLLEMVGAYAAFATLGDRPTPHFVERIEDRDGNVVWTRETRVQRVIDPAVAFIITDILRDVVDRGTATAVRGAGYRGVAAGKTGTTNDNSDVWFMGFTPEAVGGIWIGFDEPTPIVRGATGGSIAAPVWARVMRHLRGGGEWTPPPGVERRQVDSYGNIIASNCPVIGQVREEWFLEGSAPLGRCQLPSTAMWDTMYGYPYDSLGAASDDPTWLQRLRQRLFGRDSADTNDDRPRIRPGRPEDTIPMYEPGVPDPSRRPTPTRPEPLPTQPQPQQPVQPQQPQPVEPPAPPPSGGNEDDDDDDEPIGTVE
ncbi:MAG TPA: PBP1A family penicillin-binding protein [Longimicrobiales bacterium]